ncbi:MAG: polysaccharide biosynthesis C-terminal domain-containing protein, partial [Oscillospiraceae bacterium]|nr:polysaccharide biosynthesis C-terminal domain-containing protein [Oscillospiraceae bacterium]
LVGTLSTLILISGADTIARYGLGDIRAVPALKILSLGLPFMGISSCLRGYFIARRRVSYSTSAQLIEQFVRIGIIFLIIGRFASKGISAACAAVMIGDTLAETTSCLILAISYFIDRRRLPTTESGGQTKGRPRIFRRLLAIALPISAARYLNTALRTIENLLVPNCLARFSKSRMRALSEFGMLKGMALPILFFPSSFLSAFSTLLIPEITEASALGQTQKVERAVTHSLRITLLLSIPISGIFTMFSSNLGLLIYRSQEVGFLIGVLAPIMPFMYLESVVDGLLKGLDQQVSSLKYSMFDSVFRITAIILLVPARGMKGFLFIMIVSNILTSSLNIHRLLVVTGVRMRWAQWVLKPLLAIITSGVVTVGLQHIINGYSLPMPVAVLILSAAMLLMYAVLLYMFGSISAADFILFSSKR